MTTQLRTTAAYAECMAGALVHCAQGFCPTGSVCTYQQCWAEYDKQCVDKVAAATQPSLPPPPPTVPADLPETPQSLGWLQVIYGAAQQAAGVVVGTPSTAGAPVPDDLLTKAVPAITGAVAVLNPTLYGIDVGGLFKDLLGYHVAVKQKAAVGVSGFVGDTNAPPPTWPEINQALETSTPPAASSTVTAEELAANKKRASNRWLWIVGGAVAVIGVAIYANRRTR